ncbi:metallophosphoesterase [Tenacibaculum amylolyticum]|uniref:metallophosphoesterase n=1 Tax=Tenacibaculum amylolyticum TaxID=104269 RepID=UPI0038957610
MKKRIITYVKNITGTLFILLVTGLCMLLFMNGTLGYETNPLRWNLHNEGPYVFYENDSTVSVNYIQGNKKEGFSVAKKEYPINNSVEVNSHFVLDNTEFTIPLDFSFETPKAMYSDGNKIIAISDIESNYKTFRDFLLTHKVIDTNLEWIFGEGHLVLVGDFVDRGDSTTQLLWFIYSLEQQAKKQGGKVHFILGNHELKNLQGNFKSTTQKYRAVANILEKQLFDLYSENSFLGKWLTSKNTIEVINGYVFVHGGLHPSIAKTPYTLEEINEQVKTSYRKGYYPKKEKQLLTSTKTGIAWYRGYFKENLSEEEVTAPIKQFKAKAVVVGHTIQNKVKELFNGKVIAIDVKHPEDYQKSWPAKKSEGLLIENNTCYRILSDGERVML